MPSNQNPQQAAPPNPSDVQSQEWLYDEIMRYIEPELMTNRKDKLAEMIAGETAGEREARKARYEQAFGIFDAVYKDVAEMMVRDAATVKEQVQKKLQEQEYREKQSEMHAAEDQLDSFDNA